MLRVLALLVPVFALGSLGCDRAPSGRGGGPGVRSAITAVEACRRLEAAELARGCHATSVEPALTPRATSRALFTLPSGKLGQVLAFDAERDYHKSAKSIGDMASAGQHHFGNPKAKIYVQLNGEATDEEAKAVEDLVSGF
jgi:hypothetical protein